MLGNDIQQTLAESMKSGDKLRVSVLRMVIAQIKNKKIADKVKELKDETIVALIQKMARQHKESIEQFSAGGREDLVNIEKKELEILEEYLPKQLSKGEVEKIIAEAIEQSGASSMKDMGSVMSACQSEIKGRADGKMVSDLVKEKLSN